MFALYLWLFAIAVAFCAGVATGAHYISRPKRNRFIGTPDPRCERAGNIYEFRRRAS